MHRANRWILFAALALFALLYVRAHRAALAPARLLKPLHAKHGATIEEGGYLIDLNAAGVEMLDALPGIGEELAQNIVEHRAHNGPFASVDELDDVEDIGPTRLEAVRDSVTVR